MAPPARHLEYGSAAEALAARFLAGRGLHLLASNFRCRIGELDLVMADRSIPDQAVLVIVEVRSRRRSNVAMPGATIYRSKQRRLIGATRYFLLRHRQFAGWPVRFDVVEILGELENPAIRWSRAAFSVDDVACR